MLKELAAFVESLQHELENRGGRATDIQIEIKCKTIAEWAILDQVVENELRAEHPEIFTRRRQPYHGLILPHMLTYRETPVRITYDH